MKKIKSLLIILIYLSAAVLFIKAVYGQHTILFGASGLLLTYIAQKIKTKWNY